MLACLVSRICTRCVHCDATLYYLPLCIQSVLGAARSGETKAALPPDEAWQIPKEVTSLKIVLSLLEDQKQMSVIAYNGRQGKQVILFPIVLYRGKLKA